MSTNLEAAFVPVTKTMDAANDSLRILSDGVADLFDIYCQISLSTLDVWLRAVQMISLTVEAPRQPTAEIVRMRPRRA